MKAQQSVKRAQRAEFQILEPRLLLDGAVGLEISAIDGPQMGAAVEAPAQLTTETVWDDTDMVHAFTEPLPDDIFHTGGEVRSAVANTLPHVDGMLMVVPGNHDFAPTEASAQLTTEGVWDDTDIVHAFTEPLPDDIYHTGAEVRSAIANTLPHVDGMLMVVPGNHDFDAPTEASAQLTTEAVWDDVDIVHAFAEPLPDDIYHTGAEARSAVANTLPHVDAMLLVVPGNHDYDGPTEASVTPDEPPTIVDVLSTAQHVDPGAVLPHVCKTPGPGGPLPVPYPNIATSSQIASGSATVEIEGNVPTPKTGQIETSIGDETGAARATHQAFAQAITL